MFALSDTYWTTDRQLMSMNQWQERGERKKKECCWVNVRRIRFIRRCLGRSSWWSRRGELLRLAIAEDEWLRSERWRSCLWSKCFIHGRELSSEGVEKKEKSVERKDLFFLSIKDQKQRWPEAMQRKRGKNERFENNRSRSIFIEGRKMKSTDVIGVSTVVWSTCIATDVFSLSLSPSPLSLHFCRLFSSCASDQGEE